MAGKEKVTNRFCDWKGYREERTMGSISNHLLTPLGEMIMAQAKVFVGRSPKYKGASQGGIYLKWIIYDDDEGGESYRWRESRGTHIHERVIVPYRAGLVDKGDIGVFYDWLQDQGIQVRWVAMKTQDYTDEQREELVADFDLSHPTQEQRIAPGAWRKFREQWDAAHPPRGRVRKYVKLELQ
jgi:hypothetical protein